MSTCPRCHRPFNEGNSPNAEECNGTDDDGLCEAYAKTHAAEQRAERAEAALVRIEALSRDNTQTRQTLRDALQAALAKEETK